MAGSGYDQRSGLYRSGYRTEYSQATTYYGSANGTGNGNGAVANGSAAQTYQGYQADQYGEIDYWSDTEESGGLPRSLGLAILTIFIPGIGHAAAGRKGTGRVLLTAYLLLIATAVLAFVLLGMDELRALALDTRVLRFVAYGCAVLAVAWSLAVLSTYLVNRPRDLPRFQAVAAGLLVLLISLAGAIPFSVAAVMSYTGRDLIVSISGESTGSISGKDNLDYFKDKPRVNVLLLGGDWTDNRQGIRTDSMMVASIDTRTGQALMISLPRNLYRVPFPEGTEAYNQFPDGFLCNGAAEIECYLNAVYKYGEDHHSIVPGAKHPGAELLSQAISAILDQPVDYFAMVNLDGFQDLVNALGGIQLRLTDRIPIGGKTLADGTVIPPHDYLEAGLYKHMTGRQAMWYARSRSGSDDYARMDRQRCVMGAIARQADPETVLTKFVGLARATKKVVVTDIPADAYPALLDLAAKAKSTKIAGVSVEKSTFGFNSDPDYLAIRLKVRSWIRKANADAEKELARAAAPSPTPSGSPTARPSSTPKPKPPSAGQVGSIESSCKYK